MWLMLSALTVKSLFKQFTSASARHGSAAGGLNVPRGQTFEAGVTDGTVIAGSPETVSAAITAQAQALGINYLLTYLYFGTMSNADARRSLELFAEKVMPAIARL